MAATTIADKDRAEFIYLFELGLSYFDICIAGDPREVRNLEWDLSIYNQMHETLDATIHSEAPFTRASFDADAVNQLGRLIEFGAEDFHRNLEVCPAQINALDQPLSVLTDLYSRLVKQANEISNS